MTATIRSILVAIDESPRARLVLDTALSLARHFAAQVTLVRVVSVPPDIPPAAHTHPNGLEQKVEADGRAALQALMTEAPDVIFAAPVVLEGDPWRRILELGDELDADLIVVGSHRYHGLDRVLGTVAAKVVNHARRNVLVVHERRPPASR